MTSPEHPDLGGELGARTGQALAVLATLAEASARLAAEEQRRRERNEHLQRYRDELTQRLLTRQQQFANQAAQLFARRDRTYLKTAGDHAWIRDAHLSQLAHAWRISRSREGDPRFPTATVVAEAVEDELRRRYSAPMRTYDERVAAGVSRATAMHEAATRMAQTHPSRPHGRRDNPALHGTASSDFDANVDAERAAIRDRMQPDVLHPHYEQRLRELGAASPVAEKVARELLATQTASPSIPAAPKDTPMTQPSSAQEPRRSAQDIAADAYPDGPVILQPHQRPPGLASKRPADITYDRTQHYPRPTR
ncbi:hypothetical protein [Cryptosporangium aurantiacum]|uniref:Uncharacterized protein n=1 Tax=Cryptosporangium aurantiacum TaxID=134849 RepID=A0A1M7PR02_9ACTN|nr:hypothetical protein [Cryptosporangium aurantiacum]SHN19765.1 hypothetical protein SAMN05443668_103595 [Cryptosporangium aurantiacum]